jgi:hypothetical protein
MKRPFLILLLCGSALVLRVRGDEVIDCPSPDGKFALRRADVKSEEGAGSYKEVGVIERSTHKVVLDLEEIGHPYVSSAKLVWSNDSKRVAFFHPSRRGGWTVVYFRNGSAFDEVRLPEELPSPKFPRKAPAEVFDKTVGILIEPIRWLKSGSLLLRQEIDQDYSGSAANGIIIGFDAHRRASVEKVTNVAIDH